jgi:hypothetical protein
MVKRYGHVHGGEVSIEPWILYCFEPPFTAGKVAKKNGICVQLTVWFYEH